MKKILLLCAAMCAFASASAELSAVSIDKFASHSRQKVQSRADDASQYLVFGYCGDMATSVGPGTAQTPISAAIELPAETTQKWVGDELTRVRIGFGSATLGGITIFLTEDLEGEPFYTQSGTIKNQGEWNEFELTTPYTFEGKTIYVGYTANCFRASDYPIGMDGKAATTKLGDYLGVEGDWDHYGTQFGNVCLRIVIEGDDLPQNDVSIASTSVPTNVGINAPFGATLTFSNDASIPVEDLSVSCTVDGVEQSGVEVEIAEGLILPGETGELMISGLVCTKLGEDIPVAITITKVNGVDDEAPENNTISVKVNCVEKVFARNVVVEEFTGTWCGWCVRGITGMNYMKENYGEEGFIGIAGHYNDAMQTSTYLPVVNNFSGGSFPSAVCNRAISFDPGIETLEAYYKLYRSNPSTTNVELEATYDEDTKKVTATAVAEFSLPETRAQYRFAFVITEDNVGPYAQLNYYSGGGYGQCYGWENQPSRVEVYFNDVARYMQAALGITNSIPATIETGVKYEYSAELPTTTVTDINNCEVVAMVLNAKTYEVVNAAKVSMEGSSAVKTVAVDATQVSINAVKGGIDLIGDISGATVYGIDGKAVKSANSEGFISVSPGVYVVTATSANGSVATKKIIVK